MAPKESRVVKFDGSGWCGVQTRAYKDGDARYRDVTRRILIGEETGEDATTIITRYFEVGPAGYSTLERHDHAHSVVILEGRGRVILGDEVHDLAPFDCVYVSPGTLHQFQAAEDESLGFLCMVDRVRDRPRIPSDQEVERLERDGIPAKPSRS